jgi:hypothetical protein
MLHEELPSVGRPKSLNYGDEYRHSWMVSAFDGCHHLGYSGINPELPKLSGKESSHRRFTAGEQFVEQRRELGFLD